MRIMILFNPVAGAGRAAHAVQRIGACLRGSGYETVLVETRADSSTDWLERRLDGVAALAVVGGDGAVRLASGAAIRAATPIYHMPYGTENLFAREFGMDRRPETLLRALRRFDVRRVDAGVANDQPFLLMASIGYDADVVHDLAGCRGSSISHFSYGGPMLRKLRTWRPPRIAVTVDDRRIDPGPSAGHSGCVIVANCKQYAWRLNPARRAVMSDGQFDVLFLAVKSTADLLGWIVKCRFGRHLVDRRLVYQLGRTVEIVCDQPQYVQLDGDPPPGGLGTRTRHLHLHLQPQVLPVLVP